MEMPDYDSHGIEKFRIKIGDMPGAKIDEYFDKVSDLIGERRDFILCSSDKFPVSTTI
jgi:hypothetical protein